MSSDDCATPDGRRAQPQRPRRHLRARRLRRARHRGQARRTALRPRERPARARPVPGPAVHGDRVRAHGRAVSRAPTRSSSTSPRRTRSCRRWPTSATSCRASATWAARCAWACTPPSSPRAPRSRRPTASPTSTSGTATATRWPTPTVPQLEEAGLRFSGTSPDGRLVEFVELPADVHPYYVGTQAHPEFRSRPDPRASAVRRPDRRGARALGAAARGTRAGMTAAAPRGVDRSGRRRRASPLPVIGASAVRAAQVWSVVSDDVDFGGIVRRRDVIVHPGAVAIIALDDADRVLLIRQYRHPVGRWLFEPPAGLLDEPDEPPWLTAARELAEEAGYEAADWYVLSTSSRRRAARPRRIRMLPRPRPRPAAGRPTAHRRGRGGAPAPGLGRPRRGARPGALRATGQSVRRRLGSSPPGPAGRAAGRRCAPSTCRGPPATCWSPRTGCACLAAPEPDRLRTLRLGIPDSAPRPGPSPRLGGDHAPSGWTGHARRT